MKRVVAFFSALLVALSAIAGPFAATPSANAAPYVGSATYATTVANFPCNSTWNGFTAFISDWGANGAQARCNGTRWLPVGGRVLLKHAASVSGIANTATVVMQTPAMPAGLVQSGDTILFEVFGMTKSGTTDSLLVTAYAGTAGTTSDTSIITASNTALSGTGVAGSGSYPFKVASNTTIQRVGTIAGTGMWFGGGSNTSAAPAAVTITDLSTNALFFSFAIASNGGTNTVALQDAAIWHIVN